MNGKYEIDEEAFLAMSVKHQNLMMFKTYNADREEIDGRLTRLEKRKRIDTAASAGGGFFGGIMAVLLKWGIFGK